MKEKDKSTNSNVRRNVNYRSKSNTVKRKKKKKKYSRRLSNRGIATIVVMVLFIGMIAFIISYFKRDNLDKITLQLNDNIGKSSMEVQKSAKIDFLSSASTELLANLTKFNKVCESSKSTKICGVKLPNWVIYAKTNKFDAVTQITIYDFTTLEENLFGVELANHIELDTLSTLSENGLINSLGSKPYVSAIFEDGTKKLYFRYFYKDTQTKNDIPIQLCADINSNSMVTSVYETNLDLISNIVSLGETPEPISETSINE